MERCKSLMSLSRESEEEIYPKIYLYKRIVEAKLFIDANYHKNIMIEDISRQANFSKYHFLRLFKKSYGKTPHKYLTSIRIEKAKYFLNQGKSSSEVCYALSFESLSSFTHLFRKYIGMSPQAYSRERARLREETVQTPLRNVPGCFATKLKLKK